MAVLRHQVRPGAYLDSIVLMQLQAALCAEPGIRDSAAVMATAANLAMLTSSAMLPARLEACGNDDLLVVVAARDADTGDAALGQVDALLARRSAPAGNDDALPPAKSLREARRRLPEATWAAVSVPGRWAAGVAREALENDLNVFLYSDNVSVQDEISLKRSAAARGRLLLGPDCGTAILGGIGFGFANDVRRGRIGLVGASGTGLQAITTQVHDLGAGVSHAIGIGGRDLSQPVAGAAALRALALLAADAATETIVLVSKPPAAAVARALVAAALGVGKPVVVCFLATAPPIASVANLTFAPGLEQAADLAVAQDAAASPSQVEDALFVGGNLRALFAGGTLAFETLAQLRLFLPVHANLALEGVEPLTDPASSCGHTVLDMGADELTVGRLHPMIDPDLRLRRLRQEAKDPSVSTLLLDVVFGSGAEADPAARLAPVIAELRAARPALEVLVLAVGTNQDVQGKSEQITRLEAAGARVYSRLSAALARVIARTVDPLCPVADTDALAAPRVINLGLESFFHSLIEQGATAVHVAWRPPASGNARMTALLAAMRSTP